MLRFEPIKEVAFDELPDKVKKNTFLHDRITEYKGSLIPPLLAKALEDEKIIAELIKQSGEKTKSDFIHFHKTAITKVFQKKALLKKKQNFPFGVDYCSKTKTAYLVVRNDKEQLPLAYGFFFYVKILQNSKTNKFIARKTQKVHNEKLAEVKKTFDVEYPILKKVFGKENILFNFRSYRDNSVSGYLDYSKPLSIAHANYISKEITGEEFPSLQTFINIIRHRISILGPKEFMLESELKSVSESKLTPEPEPEELISKPDKTTALTSLFFSDEETLLKEAHKEDCNIKKFKDLTSESIETLKPHITFWAGQDTFLDLPINRKLDIVTTGFNRYLTEYAINYAILLDDKKLAEDLCKNGACLNVIDSFHQNKTPLALAIDYGRAKIADILIKYGAKLDSDVIIPFNNPCSNPSRFFWTLKERLNNGEADYHAVKQVLHLNKRY